jgi:hypothetical protein
MVEALSELSWQLDFGMDQKAASSFDGQHNLFHSPKVSGN